MEMKKNILLLVVIGLVVFVGYKIMHKLDDDEIYIYENFNDKNELISQTEYIKESDRTFTICASKDGKLPCKSLEGLKHGIEKWYKDGILEYQDIYNYGILEKSTLFYSNGLKNHESFSQNGRLTKENFYANTPNNEITESIIYKYGETIKRFYKNAKVYKEEKYSNDKLVSRKIYNEDGFMERLEEYRGFGDYPLDNFMDEFDAPDYQYDDFISNDKNATWI